MSIRFKFRSSATFDSINLNGLHSISVRDLRAKIIAQNKLQICKDFDLDISDADTGTVLEDENFQVMAGSSIVIKRVPAGSKVQCDMNAKLVCAPKENADEDLDDFGIDLYANIHGPTLPNSCNDVGKSRFIVDDEGNVVPSLLKQPTLMCKNSEGSEISESMSKEIIGDNCCKNTGAEGIQKHIKLEPKTEAQPKLKEINAMPQPTMLDMYLPSEYSCSLCTAIIKQAVLIPCCQYSFCEKCIQSTLLEKGKCPKCSSVKCTVDSLLPNLTLRQAIEHFIDTQANNVATEIKTPRCIPDEESGIHGKPASLLHKLKVKKMDENCSGHTLEIHNSSKALHNYLPAEANLAPQSNKGIGITVLDGTETYMPSSKHRKGERNCFMCGSPSHLIRDCPQASQSYPLQQTEGACFNRGMPMYGNPCWNANPFPQAQSYMNMYGHPGMMPYNAAIGPVSPFGIPPYMPPMCTDMQSPFGYMRMGAVPYPMIPEAKWRGPQFGEHQHRIGHPGSERDDYYQQGKQINSHDDRRRLEGEANESSSNGEGRHYLEQRHKRVTHDSFSGKDERYHRSKNTNSESQEYSKERKKDHHRKRSYEDRENGRKDFSEDDGKAIMSHRRSSHRHHNHSEHKHQIESETSHSSRSSRHKMTKNSSREHSRNERLKMVDGLSDDESRGVKRHKHRRA